jgi:hypothetical protein
LKRLNVSLTLRGIFLTAMAEAIPLLLLHFMVFSLSADNFNVLSTNFFKNLFKRKETKMWLKKIVLNHQKINVHFKIKIKFQILLIITQETKNRFLREEKMGWIRQYAIGINARTCNSASARGLFSKKMSFLKFFGGIKGFFILTRGKKVGKLLFTTHSLEAVRSLVQFLKPWANGTRPYGVPNPPFITLPLLYAVRIWCGGHWAYAHHRISYYNF